MIRRILMLLAALPLLAAAPAFAQCPPFLCYLDLESGSSVCPNAQVYSKVVTHPIANGQHSATCDASFWKAALVQVDVPAACSGITVWLEYVGDPQGFTLNLGDSETNDGFAGDAPGTLPAGQNAEAEIFGDQLRVYHTADMPPVDQLLVQSLELRDGAFKLVAKDQFLSWGQPYGELKTPTLGELFFLQQGNDNRTLYVGINRVIRSDSPGDQNLSRNGCGARHAMIFVQ